MKIGTSPFEWIEFDKTGALVDPHAVDRLRAVLAAPGIADLVVLSHGWNNDVQDASNLYGGLWKHVAAALAAKGKDPAAFAIAGVLWPAKSYDAQYDGGEEFVGVPAGGSTQALADPTLPDETDVPPERLEDMIAQVGAFVDSDDFAAVADAARKAAGPFDERAAFDFFAKAKAALGYDPAEQDLELQQDQDLFRRTAGIDSANDLLGAFAQAKEIAVAPGVGTAQGLGDVVKGVFNGARSGVVWALNKLTYYTMKKRAGLCGEALARTLDAVKPAHGVRLHLVGHSFGGRLVTSAANAYPNHPPLVLRSLTLLQAAYSHNGMTTGEGPFAGVIGKPAGPISFTHTHNDKACTVAYPIASRLNGDTAQALGDKDDRYGAMGANGPQLTGDMLAPDSATTDFRPVPGRINRFLADAYVVKTATSDAHNNIATEPCGRLVAATIVA